MSDYCLTPTEQICSYIIAIKQKQNKTPIIYITVHYTNKHTKKKKLLVKRILIYMNWDKRLCWLWVNYCIFLCCIHSMALNFFSQIHVATIYINSRWLIFFSKNLDKYSIFIKYMHVNAGKTTMESIYGNFN